MGRFVAAAIAAALVLGACTNDPPSDGFEGLLDPSGSPTAAPSPTASAEAAGEIDVTTTPDEITPEWVTAVVNTLLAEYGEMTAEILAMPVSDDPTLPEGYEDQLQQLFDGDYLERRKRELSLFATSANARAQLLPADEFKGLRFETEVVQYAQAECLVVVGRLDRGLTVPDGGPLGTLSAVSLAQRSRVGGTSNPTEWIVLDELPNTDAEGEPLPDKTMLEADLDLYGDTLQHTCEVGS